MARQCHLFHVLATDRTRPLFQATGEATEEVIVNAVGPSFLHL